MGGGIFSFSLMRIHTTLASSLLIATLALSVALPVSAQIIAKPVVTPIATPVAAQDDRLDAATLLAVRGFIKGQTDADDYRLSDSITRAEMAHLMVKAYNEFVSDDVKFDYCGGDIFKDVSSTKVGGFCSEIEGLARLGIINRSNENFRPNDSVSREELVTMLVRAFGYEGDDYKIATKAFSDVSSDSPHIGSLARAITLGIVRTDRIIFRPTATASRGEAFVIFSRFLTR